jgi:hypothetical protein
MNSASDFCDQKIVVDSFIGNTSSLRLTRLIDEPQTTLGEGLRPARVPSAVANSYEIQGMVDKPCESEHLPFGRLL